jgi:hypothetical protein
LQSPNTPIPIYSLSEEYLQLQYIQSVLKELPELPVLYILAAQAAYYLYYYLELTEDLDTCPKSLIESLLYPAYLLVYPYPFLLDLESSK